MSNKSHFFRQSSGGGGEPFIATFRTTTANESITLPYSSTGTYSGTIDWGDGTVTENTYANRIHAYTVSGDYDVAILGEIFKFGGGSAKTTLKEVKQWGNGFDFGTTQSNAFFQYSILEITATDAPKFTGTTSLKGYFYNNNSLTCLSADLSNWNTENITSFIQTFSSSASFNGNVSSWNTSKAQTMYQMFYYATSFNKDLSGWDYSSLNTDISLKNFMSGNTFSNYNSEYYDNLLIKWASIPSEGGLQPNIIERIDMGSIKYTANGAAARQSILDNNKATQINDGGQI